MTMTEGIPEQLKMFKPSVALPKIRQKRLHKNFSKMKSTNFHIFIIPLLSILGNQPNDEDCTTCKS